MPPNGVNYVKAACAFLDELNELTHKVWLANIGYSVNDRMLSVTIIARDRTFSTTFIVRDCVDIVDGAKSAAMSARSWIEHATTPEEAVRRAEKYEKTEIQVDGWLKPIQGMD